MRHRQKPPFKAVAKIPSYTGFTCHLEILVRQALRGQRVAFIAHMKSEQACYRPVRYMNSNCQRISWIVIG